MEDFLANLDNLIDSTEGVSAFEVIGALEFVKQTLILDLMNDDDEEEEGEGAE